MFQTSDAEILFVIGGENIDEGVRMITKSLKQMKVHTEKLRIAYIFPARASKLKDGFTLGPESRGCGRPSGVTRILSL